MKASLTEAETEDDVLVALGQAIGHPLRLRLIRAFVWSHEPLSRKQLWAITGDHRPAVDQQVLRLNRLGLIDLAHTRMNRGGLERFYVLSQAGRRALTRVGLERSFEEEGSANQRHVRIAELYREGVPLLAIADEVGGTRQSIGAIVSQLRASGWYLPRRAEAIARKRDTAITQREVAGLLRVAARRERDERVAALYREGVPLREIGAEIGRTPDQVSALISHLRRTGWELPRRRRPKRVAQAPGLTPRGRSD